MLSTTKYYKYKNLKTAESIFVVTHMTQEKVFESKLKTNSLKKLRLFRFLKDYYFIKNIYEFLLKISK